MSAKSGIVQVGVERRNVKSVSLMDEKSMDYVGKGFLLIMWQLKRFKAH